MRLNQNAKAEEAFDKYIQLAPDNPNVYDSKGDYYMNVKDYKKAYDAYMKSNSLNPAWGLSKATKAKHIFEVEEPARIAVTALLDKYNRAFKAKDTGTLVSLLVDGGMFCGTDPSEIWNKKQVATGFEQSFADPSLVIDYTVDKREILIAEDGKSAIVVEQAFYKFFSPNLAGRLVYRAVKYGEAWKFDFLSWSFVPRNEDIGRINKALEQ
jgi:tetratricopeptide (TPR) repeat protein